MAFVPALVPGLVCLSWSFASHSKPERKAGLPALLRMLYQAVHLVLFHTATYGESTVYNQQSCQRTQYRHISKLPASLQKTQRSVPPKIED